MTGSVTDPAPAKSASRSSALRVTAGLLLAFVAAGLADTVVSLLARAAGASTGFDALNPSSYLPLTAIGLILGAAGWAVVRRAAANPAAVLRPLVPAVVVVSFVPDLLLLGSPGGTVLAVAALMVMHVVVATAGVLAYRRVLPLPAG